MKWSDLSDNQRKGILIGWPVVVVAIFGYLTYGALGHLGDDPALSSVSFLPAKTDKRDLYKKIDKLENNIQKERKKAKQYKAKKADLDKLTEREAELKARLPSTKQKEEMRRKLQDMTNEIPDNIGKVRFVSVAISESRMGGRRRGRGQQDSTLVVNYKLSLEADMNGLIWYIHRIETHPRFMSLNNIRINSANVSVDNESRKIQRTLHKVSLDLVTYVLLEEE